MSEYKVGGKVKVIENVTSELLGDEVTVIGKGAICIIKKVVVDDYFLKVISGKHLECDMNGWWVYEKSIELVEKESEANGEEIMEKELEALNYIKGSSLYINDKYTREALYRIEKELSKLDKIRKILEEK